MFRSPPNPAGRPSPAPANLRHLRRRTCPCRFCLTRRPVAPISASVGRSPEGARLASSTRTR